MADMGMSDMAALAFGFGRDPALAAEYRFGRSVGYLANVALQPKYMAEATARERALGYTPGRWPLLPLDGTVVTDNPGILEAFQTHLSFRDTEGARRIMAAIEASGSGVAGVNWQPLALALGDESYDYEILGDPQAGHEREIGLNVRLGSTVLQLDLRGGTGLTPDDAARLGRTALSVLAASCGSNT